MKLRKTFMNISLNLIPYRHTKILASSVQNVGTYINHFFVNIKNTDVVTYEQLHRNNCMFCTYYFTMLGI